MQIGDIITEKDYTPAAIWANQNNATLLDMNDGTYQLIEIEKLKLSYKEKRAINYPQIREQLDMLWHAIDNDTVNKTSLFYKALKEVKDKYPKE